MTHIRNTDLLPAMRAGTDRQKEIVQAYLDLLALHMDELRLGTVDTTHTIQDFADRLHIHPGHLSNTIHEVLGLSPCDVYESRLMEVAKTLLLSTTLSAAQIARQMQYDPSNFSKFFKQYAGLPPGQFRKAQGSTR
jgi:AraC family transcriptional regulator of adaptative response / methylphosphotriester-DNA alkyltransferase methyltransferase